MKIVIGSKSPPKIEAISEAIKECPYLKQEDIEIISLNVKSDITDMPISIEENMIGAKNRANNAKKEVEADFYVGMEGGTSYIGEKTYLFGVVYILDKNGNGHFGFSNMIEVPDIFHKRIYIKKEELGPVLSEITGIDEVSKKNGAFGVWTDNIFTRKDQFKIAFLSSISPFYNKYYKF